MADDDLDEGPVVVKRAVYDAGMKLEADVDGGAADQLSRTQRTRRHVPGRRAIRLGRRSGTKYSGS